MDNVDGIRGNSKYIFEEKRIKLDRFLFRRFLIFDQMI